MREVVFAAALALLLGVSVPVFAQESQIESLRSSVQSAPASAAASLALGRALRLAGRFAQAQAELRRGATLANGPVSPLLVPLRWELARVQMDRRDVVSARSVCALLGGQRGAAAEGHACAADVQLVWLRATEALGETAAALAIDPQCYEAKVAEGRAEELALDSAKSQAAFRSAVAWRPEGVEAHIGLGRVLRRAGKATEALVELRKAVELDPHGPDALYELAMALAPSEESSALLERATAERPAFADAWLALGTQELSAGHVVEARKAAEAAVRNDAKSVSPHILLGNVALGDRRLDDAIREGEAALRILANSAAAELLVADAHAQKGEIDRALEAYQGAWGLDRSDPTPLVHASLACHAAARDTSARAFAVKVTQEFPDWGAGWAALGDALVGQGERPGARDAYAKALSKGGEFDRGAVQDKLAKLR